ncbi:MAG: sigma-70 family RNA polymerase sigma factor [Verrucomicrobiales bacterium]|nr:sigma-70 family RNA polymerase sigma factor [Verrucomicrobiales bacterium]
MNAAKVDADMGDETFATTHWSVVLSAQGQRRTEVDEALSELLRSYWPPLFAFLRRQGYAHADAEDLVQGFFERFLAEDFLRSVTREKGRFRSFLLAALRHHVANVHRHDRTQRRGGSRPHLCLEDPGALERCEASLATGLEPEVVFDRVWAETVLTNAAMALRLEYEASGRGSLYEVLRRWLAAEAKPGEYAAQAPALGMSEGALAVAVHRLRQRLRELARALVAHTVPTPGDVDDELRHLLKTLIRS